MDDLDNILTRKYPAKAHAGKVVAYLKRKQPNAGGLIYLEGQKTRMIEDNDEPQPFRSALCSPILALP
jgi:Xaa-Pro dipeptidase